jgi:nitrogen fixation/metabolism regulation signal transduction histidine kinase
MTKPDKIPQHKRKLRNYLLDVGLQLRYTVFIIGVAVFLTAVLGHRIYVATQETTRIVTMTAAVDPSTEQELRSQFRANDRVVVWGIVGFGALLVLTVAAAGIWMTHKIAGPLHNIGSALSRIRDNKLPADVSNLRKGDELQAFHAGFREMYDAIRGRIAKDKDVLSGAIAAIEAQSPRTPELDRTLESLRDLLKEKAQSLDPSAGS